MAGKKNNVVVAVITGLTDNQAAAINRDIIKAKKKSAPHARGIISTGLLDNVGKLLQNGTQQLIGGGKKDGKKK